MSLTLLAFIIAVRKSPFAKFYLNKVKVVKLSWSELKLIFKSIWVLALTSCGNLFITLSLFPGVTSQMQSTIIDLNETTWFPIILTSVFNIGDIIGRISPKWVHVSVATILFHYLRKRP